MEPMGMLGGGSRCHFLRRPLRRFDPTKTTRQPVSVYQRATEKQKEDSVFELYVYKGVP